MLGTGTELPTQDQRYLALHPRGGHHEKYNSLGYVAGEEAGERRLALRV